MPDERRPASYQVLPEVSRPVPKQRLASLDQFRGYTVAAMVVVNFVGPLAAFHPALKHHNDYCSYADTIMPQFFLAVGFALHWTFRRRAVERGEAAAYGRVLRRVLALALVGALLYHFQHRYATWAEMVADWQALGPLGLVWKNVQASTFQTLVHIAAATLWCLPVLGRSKLWLFGWMALSGAIHVWVLSQAYWFKLPDFNPEFPILVNGFEFARSRPVIDGGPLGFLTWSIPLLLGAVAADVVQRGARGLEMGLLLLCGLSFMALGYGLSAVDRVGAWMQGDLMRWPAPPFLPPWDRPAHAPTPLIEFWTMSQRVGTVSYQTFAAGFALVVYLLFWVAADVGRLGVGLFRTLGSNALAAYVIHIVVIDCVRPMTPRDAPLWFALLALALVLGLTWFLTRGLEKQGIFLRL
ncbi:MAG TPA: heparan-alpha-glucosaminide N-acetyltransferase domain-containing protein [Gemmatales bacterium]|nr:heparan-alpha-glucosaminide N-acetyltransferase domain-containing protein [Gemmatales bacterium]HMP59105.1 heparan-alpha-glucosaminide N-acetyltransferase domain-containing protein [Gemmatales bacterium]